RGRWLANARADWGRSTHPHRPAVRQAPGYAAVRPDRRCGDRRCRYSKSPCRRAAAGCRAAHRIHKPIRHRAPAGAPRSRWSGSWPGAYAASVCVRPIKPMYTRRSLSEHPAENGLEIAAFGYIAAYRVIGAGAGHVEDLDFTPRIERDTTQHFQEIGLAD